MTIIDRLLGRPEPKQERPSFQKAVTSLGAWGTGIPLSSLNNTPQERAAAYLRAYKVGWFYKAGKKIAGDVASLDWSLSLGDAEEGDDEATLPRPDLSIPFESLSPVDQLQRLLERPNPEQTGRQLLHKTQVRLDFAGAAALYLQGGMGGALPSAIYGISPARMWPSYSKQGILVGWVMDYDAPGGGTPFDRDEILWLSTGNSADDDIWGTSVVESVYAQVPLTEQMARHTSNVLTTGGRLAGMMWPKERSLSEDEYVDAQRAWRNVASDPDAGKRLLIFPEPMEYATGASTPAEIGIPELAILNRDEIVTAFPISPYMLGVPTPGGLNSGEVRREDRRDYWEGTIHPRADLIEEALQVGLVTRYENATGQTYDLEIAEPNLDDPESIMGKTEALKGLVAVGFDPKESVKAVGLGHIKWQGLPDLLDPAKQAMAAQEARDALADQPQEDMPQRPPTKAARAIEQRDAALAPITTEARAILATFFAEQRARVAANIEAALPATKAGRRAAAKADPVWWDADVEERELGEAMKAIYYKTGRAGMQAAADQLGRIVRNRVVADVVADLLSVGGENIKAINEKTLMAVTLQLAEGTRRGYSIPQIIEGVPAEGYAGVMNGVLENGTPVFGDTRAETIARTETRRSYNRANIRSFAELGVREFLAYDGDDDLECAARNGATFSVEDAIAEDEAEHPNGTLVMSPVSASINDKSYHEPAPAPVINLTIQNHTAPGQAPDVKVFNDITNPPSVVTVGETHVSAPEVTVNVPEQPAPVVNVETKAPDVRVFNDAPVVNVQPAAVNVQPAAVTVQPAAVNVTVPKQDAPVVNVTTPATKAATGPVEMRIVSMPDRVTKRRLERDKAGRITDTTDVEVDG